MPLVCVWHGDRETVINSGFIKKLPQQHSALLLHSIVSKLSQQLWASILLCWLRLLHNLGTSVSCWLPIPHADQATMETQWYKHQARAALHQGLAAASRVCCPAGRRFAAALSPRLFWKSWQWHRTGSRWSPVRTLPVAPLDKTSIKQTRHTLSVIKQARPCIKSVSLPWGLASSTHSPAWPQAADPKGCGQHLLIYRFSTGPLGYLAHIS